jgi:hypothetical protein
VGEAGTRGEAAGLVESLADRFGGNFSRLRQGQLPLRDGRGKTVTAAVKKGWQAWAGGAREADWQGLDARAPPSATRGTAGLITSFETTPVASVIAALLGGQRPVGRMAVLTERLVVREWLFL